MVSNSGGMVLSVVVEMALCACGIVSYSISQNSQDADFDSTRSAYWASPSHAYGACRACDMFAV